MKKQQLTYIIKSILYYTRDIILAFLSLFLFNFVMILLILLNPRKVLVNIMEIKNSRNNHSSMNQETNNKQSDQ